MTSSAVPSHRVVPPLRDLSPGAVASETVLRGEGALVIFVVRKDGGLPGPADHQDDEQHQQRHTGEKNFLGSAQGNPLPSEDTSL